MLETVCGNVEMKMYFVCMSSNRDVRILNMIKKWAAINCSKSRSTSKSFLNWWPETIK
jgi:hypothetical protein